MRRALLIVLLFAVAIPLEIYRQSLWPVHAQNTGRTFNCTMVSTATSLTEITGCAAISGQRYHITAINWSSSIISTTTNFMLLQSGTGTACATGTTSRYAAFALAFTDVSANFPTPISLGSGEAICFVHPGAGTRNITVTGFIAP